jgi:hypothetical protein
MRAQKKGGKYMEMFAADGGVQPHLQPRSTRLSSGVVQRTAAGEEPSVVKPRLISTGSRLDLLRQNEISRGGFGSPRVLLTCPVSELQPHPAYARHRVTVPTSKLSALAEAGDVAFREPLAITQDRIILDGYARFEIACRQRRPHGQITPQGT